MTSFASSDSFLNGAEAKQGETVAGTGQIGHNAGRVAGMAE
jgi:hypothetical protein